MRNFKTFVRAKWARGFTIMELMVSLAIVTLILSVVVYGHRKFDSSLEITNVAYRVALAIRQAQVYGISVKELNVDGDRSFNTPYGVNFYNTTDLDSKKSFVFFGDSNPNPGNNINVYNGPYNSGCTEECLERVNLGRGNIMTRFCVLQDNGSSFCFPDSASGTIYNGVDAVSIVFKRPKPDAVITLSAAGIPVTLPEGINLIGTSICLQSPEGQLRKVMVYATGQISVEHVASTDPCIPPATQN